MSAIGDRVRLLRKSEKLTQKEFAARLLISQSYLSGVENNNELPTNKLVKLICLEFGVEEVWLKEGIGDMYETAYENDKGALAEISNSALLTIMGLLSTFSNVEYGLYAYSLNSFALSLYKISTLEKETAMNALECFQNFMMDFERSIDVLTSHGVSTLAMQHSTVCKDIETLFDTLVEETPELHEK